jgi:hypothetical protein
MNFSAVPDITLQGGAATSRTVGRLAGLVRGVAARPADWWHLVRFDGAPEPVPVPSPDGAPLWLWAWPPGHRAAPGADVLAILAGELSERTITGQGVAERTLRANRIRVYGTDHHRELVNLGPGYALSLHASTK